MNDPEKGGNSETAREEEENNVVLVPRIRRKTDVKPNHDEEEFQRRWWSNEGDRAAMLQLLNRHPHVATYHWDLTQMDIREPSVDCLLGEYEIVFVQGEAAVGGSISRTVPPGGKLSFLEAHASEDNEEAVLLCGKIKSVVGTLAGRGVWEALPQIQTMEFRQRRAGQRFCAFEITTLNGENVAAQGSIASVSGVLHNAGSFPWSPMEHYPRNEKDKRYIRHMQKELQAAAHHSFWKAESSWLCRRLGMPVETAQNIHSYNWHRLPPPCWSWKAGDIIVFVDGSLSSTWFVARPCDQQTKDRLLKGGED